MLQTTPLQKLQSFGDKHLWFDEPLRFVRHLPQQERVVVGLRSGARFVNLQTGATEGMLEFSGSPSADHALSPSGRLLAFSLWGKEGDAQIVRLDLVSRTAQKSLPIPEDSWVVALTETGQLILSEGTRLEVWDTQSGQRSFVIYGFTKCLPLYNERTQRGRLVVAGDAGLALCDSQDGRILKEAELTGEISMWVAPSGELLTYNSERTYGGMQTGKLISWKLPALTKIGELPEDNAGASYLDLLDLACSPDGRRLYLYTEESLQCIDAKRSTTLWTFFHEQRPLSSPLWSYAPSTDQIVIGRDHRLRCIDGASGVATESLPSNEIQKVFSTKGAIFSLSKQEHVVRMWDAASGKQLRQFRGEEMALAPKDGQLIIVGGDQFNGVTSLSLGGVPQSSRGDAPFSQAALRDGCPWMVLVKQKRGEAPGALELYGRASGARIKTVCALEGLMYEYREGPRALYLSLSLDGQSLWVALNLKQSKGEHLSLLGLLDLQTARWTKTSSAHQKHITALSLSPCGKWLATASQGKEAAIWDAARHEKLCQLDASKLSGPITSMAFTQDGALLLGVCASEAQPGPLFVWSRQGELRAMLPFEVQITALSLEEDGRLLVGCADGSLHRVEAVSLGDLGASQARPEKSPATPKQRPWEDLPNAPEALARVLEEAHWEHFDAERDLPTLRSVLSSLEQSSGILPAHRLASARVLSGARLVHNVGHENMLSACALSPCGRWLTTGSLPPHDFNRGGTLQLWDVATGACIRVMSQIEGGIGNHDVSEGALQWSPDGALLSAIHNGSELGIFSPFEGWFGSCRSVWPPHDRGFTDADTTCWSPSSDAIALSFRNKKAPCNPKTNICIGRLKESFFQYNAIGHFWHTEEGSLLDDQPDMLWPSVSSLIAWGGSHTGKSTKQHLAVFALPSGELRWQKKLFSSSSGGASFVTASPDGRLVTDAVKKKVLFYSVEKGELAFTFKVESEPKDLQWSKSGRLAVFLEGRVLFWEKGEVIGAIEGWQGRSWAWSPDGLRAALYQNNRLEIWSIGEACALQKVVEAPYHAGLLWGAQNTLILFDPFSFWRGQKQSHLSFWDLERGACKASYTFEEPQNLPSKESQPLVTEGVDGTRLYASGPCFPIRVEDKWQWVTAFEDGLVVCPEGLRERLDSSLCFVVGGRFAWPFRWALQTERVELCQDWSQALQSKRLSLFFPRELRERLG